MKGNPGPGGLTAKLIWEINAIFSGSFKNIKVKEMLPNSFFRDKGTLATKPDKTLQEEKKGSISLINTDAKFFSKILVKWIQECIRHLGIVVHAFNPNTLEVKTRIRELEVTLTLDPDFVYVFVVVWRIELWG